MIRRLILIVLTIVAAGCANKQSLHEEGLSVTEPQSAVGKVFKYVADFPTIKDTALFISELVNTFNLDVHESQVQKENEKIKSFKKVKLYGSDKDYIFIEYDWYNGSMAEFPWKYQLLMTTDGRLIKKLSGMRFEFVSIFPEQNSYLLILNATARGNGGHEIYRMTSDTLQNVYEGYVDYKLTTYDAHEDISIFEPNELRIRFEDENKDGFNDIVFSGQELMLGKYTKDSLWYDVEEGKPFTVNNPAYRNSVKYIFLYDKLSGTFKSKKRYTQSY